MAISLFNQESCPDELKTYIFAHLDKTSLVKAKRVCRKWRELIDQNLWPSFCKNFYTSQGLTLKSYYPDAPLMNRVRQFAWIKTMTHKPLFEIKLKVSLKQKIPFLIHALGMHALIALSPKTYGVFNCETGNQLYQVEEDFCKQQSPPLSVANTQNPTKIKPFLRFKSCTSDLFLSLHQNTFVLRRLLSNQVVFSFSSLHESQPLAYWNNCLFYVDQEGTIHTYHLEDKTPLTFSSLLPLLDKAQEIHLIQQEEWIIVWTKEGDVHAFNLEKKTYFLHQTKTPIALLQINDKAYFSYFKLKTRTIHVHNLVTKTEDAYEMSLLKSEILVNNPKNILNYLCSLDSLFIFINTSDNGHIFRISLKKHSLIQHNIFNPFSRFFNTKDYFVCLGTNKQELMFCSKGEPLPPIPAEICLLKASHKFIALKGELLYLSERIKISDDLMLSKLKVFNLLTREWLPLQNKSFKNENKGDFLISEFKVFYYCRYFSKKSKTYKANLVIQNSLSSKKQTLPDKVTSFFKKKQPSKL